MRKAIIGVGIIMSSVLLAACGDEGGDGDSSGGGGLGNTSISPESYVAGTFKSAPGTSMNHMQYTNQSDLTWECASNSGSEYYESDRVIVVGENGMSEDDYRWGATLGEHALDRALTATGLTYAQYQSLKPGISAHVANKLLTMLAVINPNNTGDATLHMSLYDDEVLDRYFDGLASARHRAENLSTLADMSTYLIAEELGGNGDPWSMRVYAAELQRLSNAEQLSLYTDLKAEFDSNAAYYDPTPDDVVYSFDKMVVCLSSSRSNSEWGMGTKTGFEVAAKSAVQRSDDLTIATHEVIHHIQSTITTPLDGAIALERWYSEGQAVKLSGMTVNGHKNHGRNVLNVTNFASSNDLYCFGNQNEYPDYGQAYNWFLSKFGASSGMDFLFAIRNSEKPHGYTYGFESFIEKFNTLTPVACTYDCVFELSDYRVDYPNQLQKI